MTILSISVDSHCNASCAVVHLGALAPIRIHDVSDDVFGRQDTLAAGRSSKASCVLRDHLLRTEVGVARLRSACTVNLGGAWNR